MAEERTFRVVSPHMKGRDIKSWQQTLNEQFKAWTVNFGVDIDGDYGVLARDGTATVLFGLGIKLAEMNNGVTPALRAKVRTKNLTPAERVRRAARGAWRLRLRKKHAGGGVAPPVAKIVSSSWGYKGRAHDGVDLICVEDAPIFAICDAEVIDVRLSGWWGKGAQPSPGHPVSEGDGIIQIRCLSNIGPFRKGMHFGYGHAEKARVTVGQRVKAGERLGLAGYARAPHVHFMANGGGTRKGIGDRDPMPFVRYATKHGVR
jgi:murein DD-endopeptidase MepM/ murein hydrolase activator NlpD